MVSVLPRLSAAELAALAQLARPGFVLVAGAATARVQRPGTDRRRRARGRLSLATVQGLSAAGWLMKVDDGLRLTPAGKEGVTAARGALPERTAPAPRVAAPRLAAGVAGWASAAARGHGPLSVAQAALALRLQAAVEAVAATDGPRTLDWARMARVDTSPKVAGPDPRAAGARALLAAVENVLDPGEQALVWALCVVEQRPRAVEARLGLPRGGALRRLAVLLQHVLVSAPSSRR